MIFLQIETIEIYLEYAYLWQALKFGFNNCGFLLDIATPSRVWLHIETTYMTAAAVLIAAAVIVHAIKRRRR